MFTRLTRLFKPAKPAAQPEGTAALYHAVTGLARTPGFYQAPYNVPDTLDGRFDLLTFLIGTVCLRLSQLPDGQGQALSQAVFDQLFDQVELNLREAGIGDLSVPKQMRRMIQAFYGRVAHYTEIMHSAAPQPELASAFNLNVFNNANVTGAEALANWVINTWWPTLASVYNVNAVNILIGNVKSLSELISSERGHSDEQYAA